MRTSIRNDGTCREDPDGAYRMCPAFGGHCVPEDVGDDGIGVRIASVCPERGIHTVIDPFADLS